MATTTLTHKWQKITVSGTSAHEIDFDAVLQHNSAVNATQVVNGWATLELISGASVQISPNAAIDSSSPAITTANPKAVIDIRRGVPVRFTGGAGSEVFNISILSE